MKNVSSRPYLHTNPLRRYRAACVGLLFAATYAFAPVAGAKDVSGGAGVSISKTQQAQLVAMFEKLDQQIESGFKGREELRSLMQKELKQLGAIKDASQKAKAIAAYQTRHLSAYTAVLNQAAVDLPGVAKQMQAILPQISFSANRNLTITGRLRNPAKGDRPAPEPAPSETTTTLRFFGESDISCGAIAGGDAVFTSRSATSTAFAVSAGGCKTTGDFIAEVALPPNRRSARVTMKNGHFAEAFAVAVVVTAVSLGETHSSLRCGQRSDTASGVFAAAFAPLLWAAYVSEELPSQEITVTPEASATSCKAQAHTFVHSIAAAVVAETHGLAKASVVTGKLIVQP